MVVAAHLILEKEKHFLEKFSVIFEVVRKVPINPFGHQVKGTISYLQLVIKRLLFRIGPKNQIWKKT